MSRACFLYLLFFVSFSVALKAAEKEKIKLVFFELKAISGFEKEKASVLENIVLSDFYSYSELDVLGRKDIVKILDAEQFRQMIDCSDDKCLIEVSGALGAQHIVSGEIGKLGENVAVLNMQILDNQTAKALSRVYIKLDVLDPDRMILQAKKATKKLVENFLLVKSGKGGKLNLNLSSDVSREDLKLGRRASGLELELEESFWNAKNITALSLTAVSAALVVYSLASKPEFNEKKPDSIAYENFDSAISNYNRKVQDHNNAVETNDNLFLAGSVGLGLGATGLLIFNF